jgi:DnaJ-class molecular chaperone with C-terminal Zn finger domain
MSQEQLNALIKIINRKPIDYYSLLSVDRNNYTLEDLKKSRSRLAKVLHPDVIGNNLPPSTIKLYENVLKEINNGVEELEKLLKGPNARVDWNYDPEPTPPPEEKKEPSKVGYSNIWSIRGGIPFTGNIEYYGYNETFSNLIKDISNLEVFYNRTINKYGEKSGNEAFHQYLCKDTIMAFTRDPKTLNRKDIEELDRSSIIKILIQHSLMNYVVGSKVPGKVLNSPIYNLKSRKIIEFFNSINFDRMSPSELIKEICSDEDLAVALIGNLNFEYSIPTSDIYQEYKQGLANNPELASFMNQLNNYYINSPVLEKFGYQKKETKREVPFKSEMVNNPRREKITNDMKEIKWATLVTHAKYKTTRPSQAEDALSEFLKKGKINVFSRDPRTGGREKLEEMSRTDMIKTSISHSFMNYIIGNRPVKDDLDDIYSHSGQKIEMYNVIRSLNFENITPEEFINLIIGNEIAQISLIQNFDYSYFYENSPVTIRYNSIVEESFKNNQNIELLSFMGKLDKYFQSVGEIKFTYDKKEKGRGRDR